MGISEESNTEPLYEKIWVKYTLSRVMDSIILILLVLLLCYRVFSYDDMNHHSYPWFLAFMCESWFTFTWLTIISTKWNPSYTKSYPHRLFSRVAELPSVDLFVTTADPVLEPPIITVNTVLSLLALDYPSNKLSCYVSDDGCSPLNLYALVEASKFAKLWVPFCKKYNVKTRAPFRYFDSNNNEATAPNNSPEFMQEWLAIKDGYEHLCSKIQNATKKSIMLDQEFHVFSTTQLNNHPTIIKVIWENKEGVSDGVPHLIYVSREKNPNHPHRYKAGAMNVLTRVSGLMTNAPYILNVDCDMHVNNPEIVQHALCVLMDPNSDKEVAFVQCPQQFYDGLKDDPFGNQLVTIFVYIGGGVSGIQGIYYVGTNCFHRRKVLYGLSPHHHIQNGNKDLGKSSKKDIIFGSSEEFVESAAQALEGKKTFTQNANLCNSLEAAKEVAASGYEHGTDWGNKVGWMYGSSAEDILTGLTMHTKGWRSESCVTDPIAFMGCTAQDSVVQMAQYQRWGSGLLEIFFSKNCPIFGTIFGKLQFRQCLAYIWVTTWALRSVPETCYALLPAYCIITNSYFLPKDLGVLIPAALLVAFNISTLLEYLKTGLSMRSWWNNLRMSRITAMNPWIFSFVTILLKKLRIHDYAFVVTKKELPINEGLDKNNVNAGGRFIFNKSLVFVPGTTILLLQLTALIINFFGWQPKARSGGQGSGFGELICSIYVVLFYLPFLKGLFRKGKYGIPLSTICKSMGLALLFVHLSMFIV
ncbi:cellulose synthase-like protein B4 isoform X1 [Arachis hypogaea]|uniref:Cellulose synthase-like protein n=1 Tax=Arachis hypogaea TaxID=3818 RepID=A0A444Y793_ARAHY|nr:cellulose synthase-like protein B4 [Arachis hypogaea]QHN95302.1 Cellulose synthase-like protein [Arachis hypogaea]RYQ97716.1 hypothetical protein Ahy_B08g093798 isoform A [Arachis hypogaea]